MREKYPNGNYYNQISWLNITSLNFFLVPGPKPVLSGKVLTVSATNGGATTTFLTETTFKEEVNQIGCKGHRIVS